jgi:GNAT superfamily N-acetyltransferase
VSCQADRVSHRIRLAEPADVPVVFTMIKELAAYERAAHEVRSDEGLLHDALFAEQPRVWCSVLEHIDDDGPPQVAGFAMWFVNFFTWTAKHSVYLDDLFVREAFRGRGYGKALLAHLAAVCVERGYPRLDWWVLDWNPAIEFYRSLGAVAMDEWTVFRLTGEPLAQLGATGEGLAPRA